VEDYELVPLDTPYELIPMHDNPENQDTYFNSIPGFNSKLGNSDKPDFPYMREYNKIKDDPAALTMLQQEVFDAYDAHKIRSQDYEEVLRTIQNRLDLHSDNKEESNLSK